MIIYVIYKDPLDYPGKLVVRRWDGLMPDKEPLLVTEDLGEARGVLPPGVIPIGPFPGEDKVIKEVWL